ncbi:unnamed protein product, partial [Rotaria magnacalcarata]
MASKVSGDESPESPKKNYTFTPFE